MTAMKNIISVLAILQLVTARPQHNNDVKITSYESMNGGEENIKLALKTSNGIAQQQNDQLKYLNSTTNATVMNGPVPVTAADHSMHDKQEGRIATIGRINTEAEKANQNTKPQTVFMPALLHPDDTTGNSTNQTASKEYPDRIGTPAIITLMSPG